MATTTPKWSCDARDDGNYVAYGSADRATIEQLWLGYRNGGPQRTMPQQLQMTPHHQYIFDFGKMVQENAQTQKQRSITRTDTAHVGAVVEIWGVSKKPEFNGRRGQVTRESNHKAGHMVVSFPDQSEKALKPVNLLTLPFDEYMVQGEKVTARCAFVSNDDKKTNVPQDAQGVVDMVDDIGDALIDFNVIKNTKVWVKKDNFLTNLKKNQGQKRGLCSICCEMKQLVVFGEGCTCRSCDDCAKESIASELAQGKFNHGGPLRITCPCRSVIKDSDMQRIARKKDFDRYSDLLFRRFVEAMDDFIYCKGAGCGSGQIHAGGDDNPIMTCHSCKFRMCFKCNVPWHKGEICADYQARCALWAAEGFDTSEEMMDGLTSRCPKCRVRCEKENEGKSEEKCDHMTCAACGHEFCWRCLCDMKVVLAPRTGGNHHHKPTCRHYFALPAPVAAP